MSLFSELQRRNVFRVGAAYVAVSWLIIQVAETVFPAFGIGDAAVRVVILVLAIGLVPVLILAWVFELTPEGVKRDDEVDRSSPNSSSTGASRTRGVDGRVITARTPHNRGHERYPHQ